MSAESPTQGSRPRPAAWLARGALLAPVAAALFAGAARAHGGAVRGADPGTLAVPTWLFLATGGGVVAASFLLASFVTDRSLIRAVHAWGRSLPAPARPLRALGRLVGLAGLAAVLVAGLAGPAAPRRNLAILLVWVGFWGGYVALAYLVGDSWPAVDPFRTVAAALPSLGRPYPDRLGAWPAVVGLLGLVWVEIVGDLAADPRSLAVVVAGYGAVSVGGGVVYGEAWYRNADPVARLLRLYGHVGPVTRTDDGLRLRLPGAGLAGDEVVRTRGDAALVVAALYATTFDGVVATGPWARLAGPLLAAGVPGPAVYLLGYLAGFGLAYGLYRGAVRAGRERADTPLTEAALARRFAPPLVAIAAGYHLAHNLGTVVALSPTLLSVLGAPLSPPAAPPALAVPAWIGALELAAVLVGHLLAVWLAHAAAYDLFPGRLQALRSQYGVTAAMIVYTMTSLWIVTAPYVPPPGV